MAERVDTDKTAIIESPSHSVRAMLCDGETVFSARDILVACGIKYPVKWLQRNEDRFAVKKMNCPLMTSRGPRMVQMYFANAECARKMISITTCPSETGKWLRDEVFTYRIEAPTRDNEPATHDDAPAAPAANAGDMGAIGKMVDKALIELLEIKKFLAEVGAAG